MSIKSMTQDDWNKLLVEALRQLKVNVKDKDNIIAIQDICLYIINLGKDCNIILPLDLLVFATERTGLKGVC